MGLGKRFSILCACKSSEIIVYECIMDNVVEKIMTFFVVF